MGVPPIRVGSRTCVSLADRTLEGTVTTVNDYDSRTVVERVVTVSFNRQSKLPDDFDGWIPWKGYLIEEPETEYRFNLLEVSDEGGNRTLHHDVVEIEEILDEYVRDE